MLYESLRNVAMHFKAFKCVKNAFYSSALVARASRTPILLLAVRFTKPKAEMPTSGDLKSGDYLFFNSPPEF